jgi:hypothetical protein
MRRYFALAAVLLALGGCAALPPWVVVGLTVGAAGVTAGTLGLNAFHDCRQDGGCKGVPLPK